MLLLNRNTLLQSSGISSWNRTTGMSCNGSGRSDENGASSISPRTEVSDEPLHSTRALAALLLPSLGSSLTSACATGRSKVQLTR